MSCKGTCELVIVTSAKMSLWLFLNTCINCPRQKRMNGVTRRVIDENNEHEEEDVEDDSINTTMETTDTKLLSNGQMASANAIHVQPLNIDFDPKPVAKYGNDRFTRGQIDLFQMTENPDGNNNYFLRYVDLTTKRIRLRSLNNGSVSEIANVLFDIYCEQGAPCVLQSLHGVDFVRKIIGEINHIYPCRQLYGEMQGSVESAQIILNQLSDLMKRYNTRKWSSLLRILEYEINSTYRNDIQSSPFELTFGHSASMGLRSSKIIDIIYEKSQAEEEILEYLTDAELIRCSLFCHNANETKRPSVRSYYDEPLTLGCSSSRFSSPMSNNGHPTTSSLSQLVCTPDSLSQSASSSNTSFYNSVQSGTPTNNTNGQQYQATPPQSQAPNNEHFATPPFGDTSSHPSPIFFPSISTATTTSLNSVALVNVNKNEHCPSQINDCLL
ncbi:KRAB-A domain-containing protein 2-like protein [Aphelenchoides besseyi]|nr:KRAB-A domain-containing protein 2-like protein [Aphelenchoides besseyi]